MLLIVLQILAVALQVRKDGSKYVYQDCDLMRTFVWQCLSYNKRLVECFSFRACVFKVWWFFHDGSCHKRSICHCYNPIFNMVKCCLLMIHCHNPTVQLLVNSKQIWKWAQWHFLSQSTIPGILMSSTRPAWQLSGHLLSNLAWSTMRLCRFMWESVTMDHSHSQCLMMVYKTMLDFPLSSKWEVYTTNIQHTLTKQVRGMGQETWSWGRRLEVPQH